MLYAELHQGLHLQELGGDEDGHDDGLLDLRGRVGLVDVRHQPLEDLHVTVHGYVDVVVPVLILSQKLLEVLHVLNEYIPLAAEVFADLLVLIAHMDDHHVTLPSGGLLLIHLPVLLHNLRLSFRMRGRREIGWALICHGYSGRRAGRNSRGLSGARV